MMSYRIVALPETVAARVRSDRLSPFGAHPVHAETARGYGPCRVCLSDFEIGAETRILFTYDPFDGLAEYPLPGPVFIHEADCIRYRPDDALPVWTSQRRITLLAYADNAVLRAHERVDDGNPNPIIRQMLADPEVTYIHVRDTEAGCYDFRIEPVAPAETVGG